MKHKNGIYHMRFPLCKWLSHKERSTSHLCWIDRNLIAYNIFRFTWNQAEFRLGPNQSENRKYNLIPVDLTRIRQCMFKTSLKCISKSLIFILTKLWRTNALNASTYRDEICCNSFYRIIVGIWLHFIYVYIYIQYLAQIYNIRWRNRTYASIFVSACINACNIYIYGNVLFYNTACIFISI